VRAAVVDREVALAAGGDVVDEPVAQRHHLAGLLDLVGVVLRPVGVVTLAVGVDAIDEVVVVVPEPVLLLHRGVDKHFVGLGTRARGGTEQAVGEERRQLAVPGLGGREAIDRERPAAGAVTLLRRAEQIDEREPVALRDALDGGGVEGEVGVFLRAVGKIAGGGEILEGDRRHEDEPRRGAAVVGTAQGVPHEGLHLRLEIAHALRPIEGLVVAEEGDEGVGLQVRQPLVRRREKALAVVRLELGAELLGAGKRPLRNARRMRAETRRVAGAAEVAHDEFLAGETQVQLGLEPAVVHVALGEAVAEKHHPLALLRCGDALRPRRARGRRFIHHRVRPTGGAGVGGGGGLLGRVATGLALADGRLGRGGGRSRRGPRFGGGSTTNS
jgi:hypothetical protein